VKSITVTHWKAAALAEIGNVLAPTDPGRATRLIVNAERIAQAITEASDQGFPLTVIVKARWQPPTRTARNASPRPSPMSFGKPGH
jgi:hypothetical protein